MLVGRLLDFLRARGSDATRCAIDVSSVPRLADAVATYQVGGLALMDNGSIRTYRTWHRRLVDKYPDADPRQITAGDLTDLIAHYVVEARRRAGGSRRAGPAPRSTPPTPTATCGSTSSRRAGPTRRWPSR